MGFTLPAAIGAQLARPDAQVLAVCGDGDFLQTMQELGDRGDARHAGLHGRPRQLGLDQHQGRAAGAFRPHRRHRLPARREALLAGLRGHRSRLRHPHRVRRAPRRGSARRSSARWPAAARRSSTSAWIATWPWPGRTRPAGGTCRCPRDGPVYDDQLARSRRGAAPMSLAHGTRSAACRSSGTTPTCPTSRPRRRRTTVLDEIARLGFAGTQHGRGLPEGDVAARAPWRSAGCASRSCTRRCRPDRTGSTDRAADIARRDLGRLIAGGGEVLVVALDGRRAARSSGPGRVADGAPRWPEAAFDGLAALLPSWSAAPPTGCASRSTRTPPPGSRLPTRSQRSPTRLAGHRRRPVPGRRALPRRRRRPGRRHRPLRLARHPCPRQGRRSRGACAAAGR